MQGWGVEGATAGWGAGGRFGHPGGTRCLLSIHYVSACHLHQAVFPASPERWREPAPLRGRGTWVSDRVRALRRHESRDPSQCDPKPRLPETDLSPGHHRPADTCCGAEAAWAGGVPSGEGDATRHPRWEVQGWGGGLGSSVPVATSSSSLGLPGSRLGILRLGRSCLLAPLISVPYRCLFAHREFKHDRGHGGVGRG